MKSQILGFLSFLWLNNTSLYFLCPLICQNLSYSMSFIVNKVSMNGIVDTSSRYWFNFLQICYLEVGLLVYIVALFLIFWGIFILFFIVVVPTYIHRVSAQEFTFSLHHHQHLLSAVCLIISILTDVRWYIIVDLISVFQMISVIDHVFMSLLIICMSS